MKTLPIILFSSLAVSVGMSHEMPAPDARVLVEPIRPRPPIFIIPQKREQDQEVVVESARYEARLVGRLCETTVTMTLRNPNSRIMEGEFSFPLPAGATISGYALDIEGKLVDAVPVTKEKARVVLEEEARRNVDPGLVESVGGNMFRTRIYPLTANGTRTVRFRYVTELSVAEQGGSMFRLPLNFENKLKNFELKLEVVTSNEPRIASSPVSNISFEKQESVFVAEKKLEDIALTEDIVVELPAGAEMQPLVEKYDGVNYLLIPHLTTEKVELPEGTAVPKAEQVNIVWDASGSMAKANVKAAIDALCSVAVEGVSKINLIIVRNTVGEVQQFSDAASLRACLESIEYDGSSADLAEALVQLPSEGAITFIVSDGMSNAASDDKSLELVREGKPEPVVALLVSTQVDLAGLRRLRAEPMRVEDYLAAPNLLENQLKVRRIASVTLNGQAWESALYTRESFDEKTPCYIVAELPEGEHEISYETIGFGAAKKSFRINTASAREGTLARNVFGQAKLNVLLSSADSPLRAKMIQQLGQEYGLVTEGTSLLVLENLEQYQRHQVRPPASAAEMRKSYDAYMTANADKLREQEAQALAQQLTKFKTEWEATLSWYEKDFSKVEAQVAKKDGKGRDAGVITGVGVSMGSGGIAAGQSALSPEEMRMEEVSDDFAIEDAGAMPASAAPSLSRASHDSDSLAKKEKAGAAAPAARIEVKAWSSNAPYLITLAEAQDKYAAYFKLKEEYGTSPGFYLDCTDFFAEKCADKKMALQVLSNLMEMNLEDRSLMRVLGYKLRFMGELKAARTVLQRVLQLFPEEPQSYRDLALVHGELGEYQAAMALYKLMLAKKMHERFIGIEQIALVEMNQLIVKAKAANCFVDLEGLDKELIKPMEMDMRVVMSWDTDNSDMDLWVTDQSGEKCMYSHNRTATGGHLSRDVTQGYGPEQFFIRAAREGKYKVESHYYGTRSQKMLAPVTLYAEVFTNYGRPNEERQVLIFRLDNQDKVVHVADMEPRPRSYAGEIKETRDYQIKGDDSLASIAQKELGNPAHVALILRLNPELKEGEPLKRGTLIKLPK